MVGTEEENGKSLIERVTSLIGPRLTRYYQTLPVVIEAGFILFTLYVSIAILNHESRIKHSALLRLGLYRVSLDREKPREHNAKKFFQNQHGLWIHYCLWKPPNYQHIFNKQQLKTSTKEKKIKGVVIFLHGHSEHVNRHEHSAEVIAENGYIVYGIDHQGFGRSEGDRGHVERFQHYIDDIITFVAEVLKPKYQGTEVEKLPKFIISHSMGSLINILVTLRCQQLSANESDPDRNWYRLTGTVLGSPPLHMNPKTNNRVLIFLLRMAAYLFPKLPLIGFPSDPTSSFLQTKMHSQFDPLNYQDKIRPHQLIEMIDATRNLQQNVSEFSTPVLLFHGTKDPTCNIQGSRDFMAKISSKDKQLLELEGLTHEPLQEAGDIRKPVLDQIIHWLDVRSAVVDK